MPEKISIVKDGGESINSNIVSVFMIPDLSKKYIITTENAVDPHGLTVLHVSEISGDSLVKVATDEEWSTIKTVMRAIISGSVGNYQYIPSFETINAAGQYSRDISVSAPASKQMIDSYASGEKVEPIMEESEEILDNSDSDSIFPTAPVAVSEDEVAPGISMEDPVTIENTPDAPEIDPSVQGAKPLDPASLPVQEPAQVAPVVEAPAAPAPVVETAPVAAPEVPTPAAPTTPAPQIPTTPAPVQVAPAPVEAPAPVQAAPAPTEVPVEATVQQSAPEAAPAPIIDVNPAPEAPAPEASEKVLGAEMVPEATPVVDSTTPVAEVVVEPVVTPDTIVANVDAVSPMPESIMEEPVSVPATQNSAAIAVPADPNAVEVSNSAPANESVAPEIDALAATPVIVDAAPAVEPVVKEEVPAVLDNTVANVTQGVVDVLAPAGQDAVVTVPTAQETATAVPAAPEIPVMTIFPHSLCER